MILSLGPDNLETRPERLKIILIIRETHRQVIISSVRKRIPEGEVI
jgi:hypothetical protein